MKRKKKPRRVVFGFMSDRKRYPPMAAALWYETNPKFHKKKIRLIAEVIE